MSAVHRTHLELLGFGTALGAVVSAAGFTDFGQLHRMFTFADSRLVLTFAGAVVLAGLGFALHCKIDDMPRRPIRAGTIPGALLFGVGWAISGGCPGSALAQLGEGKLGALVTLGGILAGIALGNRCKSALGLDSGSCGG